MNFIDNIFFFFLKLIFYGMVFFFRILYIILLDDITRASKIIYDLSNEDDGR